MQNMMFLIQFLAALVIVGLSAWVSMWRFRWPLSIACIYAIIVLGVHSGLVWIFRAEPWHKAHLIPAVTALAGIAITMGLSEHFWRRYRLVQVRLMQSEKMVSLAQLVAGLAHELNTPLGTVKSNLDIIARAGEKLKAEVGDDTQDRNVGRLFGTIEELNRVNQEAVDRMDTIVRSLRNFVMLDEAEYQETDLHENIESILALTASRLEERITIKRNYGTIQKIRCYPDRINQVFMNVLINAVEAIEDRGEIRIETRDEGVSVVVQISDTGIGIPAKHLAKIFDPGFTTRSRGVGTGLGLSVCFQIIQDAGGRIEVESEQGSGTVVTIRLPIDCSDRSPPSRFQ